LQSALAALAALNDLDLVAAPDTMSLRQANGQPEVAAIVQVQRQMLTHCAEQGDRLAILDALPAGTTAGILEQRDRLTIGQAEPVNGALYHPWLRTIGGRLVPPCGHVAGIFARSDARVGVFKAPANEEVFGVLDLETDIDNSVQDQLNPEGVNCLRAFRGRGIRVWGARTLSRDPNWRYVSVRRLFLTLRRWIDLNMAWAAFEPNEPRLWVRIQRELTTYLANLLRDGALRGTTPEQAFYVKCDVETNPPELREVGQVVTEIGLAPLAPAEFIVVRIIHRAGTTDIS
jgi:phage tail sheath protein FI